MRKRKPITVIVVILALLIAAVSVTALLLLRYHKHVVEIILGRALGADVDIEAISVDLKSDTLRITGFKLHNPKDFAKDAVFAYVPEITGKYDRKSAFVNKKLHFTDLYVYVRMAAFIKDKAGRLNADQLAVFKENFQELPLQTDRLILTADYAAYKDLSGGGLPHTEVFEVRILNALYEGFPTFEDITAKVMSEIMKRTTIKGAKLLGLAVIAGAAGGWSVIIPAEAVMVLSGKDSYQATFDAGYEDAYKAGLETAKELSKKFREYKDKGMIKGHIDGADVAIMIRKRDDGKTDIAVSARKHLLPKLNIAGGVLYEIAQKLPAKKQAKAGLVKYDKD